MIIQRVSGCLKQDSPVSPLLVSVSLAPHPPPGVHGVLFFCILQGPPSHMAAKVVPRAHAKLLSVSFPPFLLYLVESVDSSSNNNCDNDELLNTG